MKGKKKGGKGQEKFKVVPKVVDLDQQLIELNYKKKFLEDRFSKIFLFYQLNFLNYHKNRKVSMSRLFKDMKI